MPSPIKRVGKSKYYRRKSGAYTYKGKPYAKHSISRDRSRVAKKSSKRQRYPQAYD